VDFCESPPKPIDLIDLTKEEDKEREDDTPSIQVPLPVVVKTEPIEVIAVRKSFRKSDVIPEKEAPENVIEYHFVPERENFCESPPNQEEDDKKRKDAADHTAKQYKLTPRPGASSMPVGLTPRPAVARYPKKLPLTVNYNGIPKLKIPIFDGKLSEYQKFKLTFNTAYDNGRNLPKQHLVSLLEMSLKGKPLKFVSDFTKMSIGDQMYACMWQLLDDKYSDRNTEDEWLAF
jgi:hypothetical protein